MKYFEQKDNLLTNIRDLKTLIKEQLDTKTEELDYFEEELENINFNVLCLGDFSSGKSTFINNFFLEDKIKLPTRATTTTAKLTIVKYGKELKVLAVMKDSSQVEIKDDIEESLKNLVATKGNQLDDVEFVEIQLPSSILKEGVVIVDSPGLNDPESERMDITYRFVNQADCVLYFLNASQAWKKSEKEFLEEKILCKDDLDKIFFLLNYWDIIDDEDEREEIVEYVSDEIEKSISIAKDKLQNNNIKTPPLIPISSKTGENFDKLKVELFSYLTGKKAQDILNVKINKYNSYIEGYLEIINEKENLSKENQEEILKKQNQIKEELKKYKSTVMEIKTKIKKSVGNKYHEFVDNLQYAYDDIVSNFENNMLMVSIEDAEEFKKYYQISFKKAELKSKSLISEATSRFKREVEDIFDREKSTLSVPYKKILDDEFLETKMLSILVEFKDDIKTLKDISIGTSILSIIGGSGMGLYSLTLPTTIPATTGYIPAAYFSAFGSSAITTSGGMTILATCAWATIPLAIAGGAGYLALKKLSKDKFQKTLTITIEENVTNLKTTYDEKVIYLREQEDEVSSIIAENINNEFINIYEDKLEEYKKILENKNAISNYDDLKEKLISLKLN